MTQLIGAANVKKELRTLRKEAPQYLGIKNPELSDVENSGFYTYIVFI
jgi:hypothetical protein